MSITQFRVEANGNYDAGFQIGQKYKKSYDESFEGPAFKVLQSFYKSEEGRIFVDRCISVSEKCYPGIIQELRGMAEGTGLPVENFYLHSMASEIWLCFKPQGTDPVFSTESAQKCTDVQVNSPEFRMMAHNEDWIKEAAGKCFIIDMTINKDDNDLKLDESISEIHLAISKRNERFISFVTPGDLPGLTYAMNRHLAFTINSLIPVETFDGGIPIGFLLRGLLACETVDECVAVMKNEPYGSCYGINVNIASIHTPDMWSLEVYTDKTGSSVKLTPLPQHDVGATHYTHTNHYKHTPGAKEVYFPNSVSRDHTAQAMTTPTDMGGLCNILGDMSHPQHQIYRLPGLGRYATLATAMFDLNQKILIIFNDNPKTSEPHLTVPFIV